MLRRLLRWGVFLIGVALLVTGIRLSWYRLAAVPIRTWTLSGQLEKAEMVGVNPTNRTGEFGIFLDPITTAGKGRGEILIDLLNPPSVEPVKVPGWGVTFAPAGNRVLYFDSGIQYRIWEAGTPMPTAKITPKQDLTTGGGMTIINALSPAGDVLAMTSVSTVGINGVSLFSAKDGKKLRDLHGHKQSLHQCDFRIDGTKILTASKDGKLILWDVTSGKKIASIAANMWVMCARLSPDGRRVAASNSDFVVKVWDVATGKELLSRNSFPPIPFPIYFSNDGRYLLVQAHRRSPLDELLIFVKAITRQTSKPFVECVDIETNQVVGRVNDGLYLGISSENHLLTCQGNSIEEYELPLKAHYTWMVFVCVGCVLFAIPLLLPFRWIHPLFRRRRNEVTAIP